MVRTNKFLYSNTDRYKNYLKKNKEKGEGLLTKPNDGEIYGYVYKSDLNGHIKQGPWIYTDGKITHKIFNCMFSRNKRSFRRMSHICKMGLFDMAVNASSYSTSWNITVLFVKRT